MEKIDAMDVVLNLYVTDRTAYLRLDKSYLYATLTGSKTIPLPSSNVDRAPNEAVLTSPEGRRGAPTA